MRGRVRCKPTREAATGGASGVVLEYGWASPGFANLQAPVSVNLSGSGVTVTNATVATSSDTVINATYTVAGSAPLGSQNLTVSSAGSDGGQGVASPPFPVSIVAASQGSVTGISPAQGLIGTTVSNVTISGSGFGSSPTVNAGTGITVTYVSRSSTSIKANFAIAASAPAGNNNVVVTTTAGSQLQPVVFYVQTPSKLSASNYESLVLITNGSVLDYFGNVLKTNRCGGYRNIAYNLLDQKGGTILGGNFTLTENFSNYSTTVSGLTIPPTQSSTQNTSVQTLADTQFFGTVAPSCPGSNDHESFNQSFSVTVGSTTYPLSTVNLIQRGEYSGTFHVDVTVQTP